MILIGDTIRLDVSFYSFAGVLADPDSVTVKIYAHIGQQVLTTATASKSATGVYYYYYTVPVENGKLVYEFSGTMDGTATLIRGIIEPLWV